MPRNRSLPIKKPRKLSTPHKKPRVNVVVAFIIVHATPDGQVVHAIKEVDGSVREHMSIYQELLDQPGRLFTTNGDLALKVIPMTDASVAERVRAMPAYFDDVNPATLIPTVLLLDCADVFSNLSYVAAEALLNATMEEVRL